jgi:hypothetical protein
MAHLADDCLLNDQGKRRLRSDATALEHMLIWDDALFQPHEVLANEKGLIRDSRRFSKAFRELLQKGCGIRALSQSLCYFWSCQQARRSAAGRIEARFPSRERMLNLVKLLRGTAEEVAWLELCYSPSKAVRDADEFCEKFSTQHPGLKLRQGLPLWFKEMDKFKDMAAHMSDYAHFLESWVPPRADSIRSYGLIAPCVYCQIATGKPQFRPVSELFSSCSRKDFDPNLLSKRLKYFQKQFPAAFSDLHSVLAATHQSESMPYWIEGIDFESLLADLPKSKS